MSDRYEIRGKLGKGGMSMVYRAYDKVMGREVALKRLLPLEDTNLNESAGHVLASEAAALARFQHPNIVTVYAFEEDNEGPYVVMELVEGEDLHQVLQEGALSLEDFEDIAVQCLEPLVNAGEMGLLHRDIKPGNIMLTMTASERFIVKLLDFGLAKFSQQPSTQTLDQAGSFLGSIDYIAPEQLELEPLDQRTDLYSLGCVLYYALAQEAPFSGDNPAKTSMNHLNHAVKPIQERRPDLPQPMADWIMRLISRYPSQRPDNALAALSEFQQAQRGESIPALSAPDDEGPVVQAVAPQHPTGPVLHVPGTGAVARPTIHTSRQIPRSLPKPVDPLPVVPTSHHGEKPNPAKHPAVLGGVGGLVLLLLLLFIFGGGDDEVSSPDPAEVAVVSPLPLQPDAAPEPAPAGFEVPQTLRLGGAPVPLFPVENYFLRYAAAEGVLGRDFEPLVKDGEEVFGWVNLETRTTFRSLFPASNDLHGDRVPRFKQLEASQRRGLKESVAVVSFSDGSVLASRSGPLDLSRGFTLFAVAKLDPGSGRIIQLEPNGGGGRLASIEIDFSSNVVATSRLGASAREWSVKAPWSESGTGVIAYASEPTAGKHSLHVWRGADFTSTTLAEEFPPHPSSFQRVFVGRNDSRAAENAEFSSWFVEILLFDRVLGQAEIGALTGGLADYYFVKP